MKSRPIIGWLCALLLVLAQHTAWAHGISHLGAQGGGDDPSLPLHSKVCDQCHQASQLGTGVAPTLLVFASDLLHSVPAADAKAVFEAASLPPFSSRAPPRVS